LILHIILNNQLGKRLFFFSHYILSFFLIALLINYQFMPHPELDVKCEKKILVESLSAKSESFWKKKLTFFLLLLKNPNDFFYLCSWYFPPYIENYEKVHDYCQPPTPLFNSCEFFSCFEKKKDEKPVFKKNITTKLIRNSYINVEKLSCGVASCCTLFKGSLWKRSYLNCYFICKHSRLSKKNFSRNKNKFTVIYVRNNWLCFLGRN